MAKTPLSEAINGQEAHSISHDTVLREAARLLCADWAYGALPVTAEGRLAGIVSKHDLICKAVVNELDLDTATAAEIMTPDPVTLPLDATLADAYRLMRSKKVKHIPVMDGGDLVGMVAYRDIPAAVKTRADRLDGFSLAERGRFEH